MTPDLSIAYDVANYPHLYTADEREDARKDLLRFYNANTLSHRTTDALSLAKKLERYNKVHP
jgi:hypothetical protein